MLEDSTFHLFHPGCLFTVQTCLVRYLRTRHYFVRFLAKILFITILYTFLLTVIIYFLLTYSLNSR